MEHLDIKSGFFHGDLKEENYIHQPPDFEELEKEKLACKLQKIHMWLKSTAAATTAWYDKLN